MACQCVSPAQVLRPRQADRMLSSRLPSPAFAVKNALSQALQHHGHTSSRSEAMSERICTGFFREGDLALAELGEF